MLCLYLVKLILRLFVQNFSVKTGKIQNVIHAEKQFNQTVKLKKYLLLANTLALKETIL